MGGTKTPEAVVREIAEAVSASPKRSKRVLFKTLLRAFRFSRRTDERIELISRLLAESGLNVFPPLTDVDRNDWVTLSIIQPAVPVQEFAVTTEQSATDVKDEWFDDLARKVFESEREVEIRFVLPLLQRLGYTEDDRADGYPVEIFEGVRRSMKEADFVLFDGRNRTKDNALLVIEAKAPGKRLGDYIGQARTYAIWLGTPYYMVTDGNELRVFLFRSAIESDVEVFAGTRQTLREGFQSLYNLISRQAVVAYKAKRLASR